MTTKKKAGKVIDLPGVKQGRAMIQAAKLKAPQEFQGGSPLTPAQAGALVVEGSIDDEKADHGKPVSTRLTHDIMERFHAYQARLNEREHLRLNKAAVLRRMVLLELDRDERENGKP